MSLLIVFQFNLENDVKKTPLLNPSRKRLQERQASHRITIEGSVEKETPAFNEEKDQSFNWKHSIELDFARVNVYKGHPVARKQASCEDPGKLIKVPHSMEELKRVAGNTNGKLQHFYRYSSF